DKDLEYRLSQEEALETRLEKNKTEYEKTKAGIQDILQHMDDSDEDLLNMYADRDTLEQGVKELSDAYYELREKAVQLENKIGEARKEKETVDQQISELKDQENA